MTRGNFKLNTKDEIAIILSIITIFLLTYMYTYVNWKVSYPNWWGFETMGAINFLLVLISFGFGWYINETK